MARLQSSVYSHAERDDLELMAEIQLHNTLAGKIEKFVPQKAGEVRMYTCGPTVYDYAHIGNYRTFVFQDILKDERPIVADVRVVVDRRPAGIHAHFARFLGHELLDLAGQRVVQLNLSHKL